MRNAIFIGILVLAFASCASSSAPRGEPTPFEGRWLAVSIEEPGTIAATGFLPYVLLFERNRLSSGMVLAGPDGAITSRVSGTSGQFTYTTSEITVDMGRNNAPHVFRYVLTGGTLTTIDTMYGRVVWERD